MITLGRFPLKSCLCHNKAAFSCDLVKRHQPELVAPAKPTRREMKLLSDIDSQKILRDHIPMAFFYGQTASMKGKDPAQVIKKALSEALVFYYPFAGRLREGYGGKLMVDCNEEGVMFIEADADITLEQFGDTLQPPFPYFDELLYNAPLSEGFLNCPLLIIQVTRLRCGGFILAYHFNHTMCDGVGMVQFLNALAEIARGASEPSITPVWQRELLSARNPPRITHMPLEHKQVPNNKNYAPMETQEGNVLRSFFFGSKKLRAFRQLLSHCNDEVTTFEALTALLWRCRVKALQLESDEEVSIVFANSLRFIKPSFLPVGYYGNAIMSPVSVTTAGELCENSLGYALDLVKKVRSRATVQYMQSFIELLAIEGQPHLNMHGAWAVSDISRLKYKDVDFGWGKALFGGTVPMSRYAQASIYFASQNARGEEGLAVSIVLPPNAMERFSHELDYVLGHL